MRRVVLFVVFFLQEMHMNYVLWFFIEGPAVAVAIGVALAIVEYKLIHA